MGYNEAVRWSKDRMEFGKGKLEGVISSETAADSHDGRCVSDARYGAGSTSFY